MTTHWRNPQTGLIETIAEDGTVLAVQKSLDNPFDATTKAGFTEVVRPNGTTFWTQAGVDTKEAKDWFYNPMLGGAIAGEVSNGGRLSSLHKKHTWCPPYAILARWLSKIPEFKEMVDEALRHRATLHFEEIIEIADETAQAMKGTEDEFNAGKLKIDARKFMAEKGDQDKYGTKNKGGGDVAVQIVIDTGIIRDVSLTGIEAKQITDKEK
jgi:hypothetical protein